MPEGSQSKPADGAPLGHAVRTMLSERLISGAYAPGDKLSLRRLAAGFGVSMMPVREAVSRLVADGALEVTPNRAVRVPVLDVARFRELSLLRIEIEGLAAAWAADRHSDADLDAIAEAEAGFRIERARPSPNLPLTVAINQKLHFAIYRAAGSPMLVDIITGLWLKVGPILNLDMATNLARVSSGTGERYHTGALTAIRARDRAGARDAIAGDIAQACDYIISLGRLPPHQPPQHFDGSLTSDEQK